MFKKKKYNLLEDLHLAQKEKCAIGQFNFSTMCQMQGISKATKETGSIVICGTSENEANFIGMDTAIFLRDKLRQEKNVKMFLNLDHGKSFESIKRAIDLGYDMVHFDGSSLPFEESIEITKKVVKYAKKKRVVVEGEISKIGGSSSVSSDEITTGTLTSIEKIAKFIRETKINCIAIDVGNVHGIYKKMPALQLERISELLDEVDCFPTLHGGSGISDDKIREAISRGVVKININTELRFAWKEAVCRKMNTEPEQTTPYKILPEGEKAVYKKTVEKINLFNNK